MDVIRYSLEEIFEEDGIDFDERERVIKNVEKILDNWKKIDALNEETISPDMIVKTYIETLFGEVTLALESKDYRGWYLSDIDKFLDEFSLSVDDRKMLVDYILLRQCSNREKLLNEKSEIEDRIYVLEEHYGIASYNFSYFDAYGTTDIDELDSKGFIERCEYEKKLEYSALEERLHDVNNLIVTNRAARDGAYCQMMPIIDKFTTEDLVKIKSNVVVASEYDDKYAKFVDYLYFYIFGEYPEWIMTELRKCPKILDKYESEVYREVLPEEIYHVKEHVKVNRNTWEFR